jgi:hypothetical protein
VACNARQHEAPNHVSIASVQRARVCTYAYFCASCIRCACLLCTPPQIGQPLCGGADDGHGVGLRNGECHGRLRRFAVACITGVAAKSCTAAGFRAHANAEFTAARECLCTSAVGDPLDFKRLCALSQTWEPRLLLWHCCVVTRHAVPRHAAGR